MSGQPGPPHLDSGSFGERHTGHYFETYISRRPRGALLVARSPGSQRAVTVPSRAVSTESPPEPPTPVPGGGVPLTPPLRGHRYRSSGRTSSAEIVNVSPGCTTHVCADRRPTGSFTISRTTMTTMTTTTATPASTAHRALSLIRASYGCDTPVTLRRRTWGRRAGTCVRASPPFGVRATTTPPSAPPNPSPRRGA